MIEEFVLYNGEVSLLYSAGNHTYRARIKDKEYKVPSVTSVLGIIHKPALLPWAVNNTVELIRASIGSGVEHSESFLEEVYAQAKKESGRIKQAAADIGTQAHELLEHYPESANPPDDGPVRNCYDAGVSWLTSHQIQWVVKECPVYSRRYRYSGRLDGIAYIDGVLSLVDWKSSKGVYPEFRLQTAAYVKAYEEEHPSEVIQQRILIRLGKEDGAFDPHVYPRNTLRKDFCAFLGAKRLYDQLKHIEKEEKQGHKKGV